MLQDALNAPAYSDSLGAHTPPARQSAVVTAFPSRPRLRIPAGASPEERAAGLGEFSDELKDYAAAVQEYTAALNEYAAALREYSDAVRTHAAAARTYSNVLREYQAALSRHVATVLQGS